MKNDLNITSSTEMVIDETMVTDFAATASAKKRHHRKRVRHRRITRLAAG